MQASLQIIPIPAYKDNYIWLIHNGSQAIIVDPGDAKPVLEILKRLGLNLQTILITHHHSDHIDGVPALLAEFPQTSVYAPKLEQYNFRHEPVEEGRIIELVEFGIQLDVIHVPGHTLGHVAYYVDLKHQKNDANSQKNLLFCGDTLFGAGCGRLFEGTAEQMLTSLNKLTALAPDTQVYCAHEYTLHNINFALTLEPNNKALIKRYTNTVELRNLNQPSLPSSIALELETNPFLRCYSHEIQTTVNLKNASDLEVFSAIRNLRNHY